MGKLLNHLTRQLKTEDKQEADNCIKIYNYLKETNDGHVWESQWNPLATVSFIGKYPNYEKRYKLTHLGNLLLKDITRQP